MVWPFLVALSVAVFAVSVTSRKTALIHAAGAVLASYMLGRVFRMWLPDDWQLVAFAALWVACGGYVLRKSALAAPSLLLVACGLCYLWARIVAAPWVFGSVPFVLSDVFAVLSMAVIGGMAGNVVYRNGLLDRNSDRRSIYSGNRAGMDAPETCQTASEVMQ